MGYARKYQVCLNETPYYHVIARCVRRAWLWGFDEYADKDYSHRKEWVLERLQQVSSVYAIDPCAYAVMSNHYHLVLHVDQQRARDWDQVEVVNRWSQLQRVPRVVQRWLDGSAGRGERKQAEATIEKWRERLSDISWYMRHMNECLARRANAEDECTGRFWEGRFKSQALLDEAGLLTAMAYVDLNPLRAGIAATPEESDFTSIYQRIHSIKHEVVSTVVDHGVAPEQSDSVQSVATRTTRKKEKRTHRTGTSWLPGSLTRVGLLDFRDRAALKQRSIPFAFADYLQLLDWTARQLRAGKQAMSSRAPPILERLNIDPEAFGLAMRPNGNVFGRALGKLGRMRLHAQALGQAWIRGLSQSRRLFPAT